MGHFVHDAVEQRSEAVTAEAVRDGAPFTAAARPQRNSPLITASPPATVTIPRILFM
jgi:hypothetical protein